jgi:hypothetical protein
MNVRTRVQSAEEGTTRGLTTAANENREKDDWTYPAGSQREVPSLDEDWENRTHLLLSIQPRLEQEFAEGYEEDPFFKSRVVDVVLNQNTVVTPSRFQKGQQGLLYFVDANWNTRLCVPRSKISYILKWIHESPFESTHAGPRRLMSRLQELFYWPSMARDVDEFVTTCDVCQKVKVDRRKEVGALRPPHIPRRPFETVSLDVITGLPESGEEKFTAILVIVDKLTKFTTVIPTHNELDQKGFAKFFVERIANVFGLPEHIIADRDKRWTSAFWKSVVSRYGSVMALSSSHHPQTDGQTEVLNALIEQMLQVYIATD